MLATQWEIEAYWVYCRDYLKIGRMKKDGWKTESVTS